MYKKNEDGWGCEYCRDGDKWPAIEEVWSCPKCDAEYYEDAKLKQ